MTLKEVMDKDKKQKNDCFITDKEPSKEKDGDKWLKPFTMCHIYQFDEQENKWIEEHTDLLDNAIKKLKQQSYSIIDDRKK